MARRPRIVAPGLLYHVIVRGNQRQKTFLRPRDYQAYLERLTKYCQKYGVTLYAYCLMPNHVHLLLECGEEPLAKFMQGIQQSYTQYFNRAHDKVGHLFQGRYKAIVCEKDEYLLALVRYIHLNPVRSKMVSKAEQYRYSAHGAYLKATASEMVNPGPVLKLLGGRAAYRRFVQDGIGEGHKEEYYEVKDQRFLGSEEFGERVASMAEERREPRRRMRSLEEIAQKLARRFRIALQVLRGPDRSWAVSRARTLLAYVSVRQGGFKVGEVAEYLARDSTTISSLISRLSLRMHTEDRLRRDVEELVRIV